MNQAFLIVVMLEVVHSLNVLQVIEKQPESAGASDGRKSLRRILGSLANAKRYLTGGNRRAVDPYNIRNARNIFDSISNKKVAQKKLLRDAQVPMEKMPDQVANIEHHTLTEQELQDAQNKHTMAILHNAWVQKRGRNDFLVLADEAKDPFVTVIPNNIYYDIQKKCVNWLDDCSLQGIRAKLLNRVLSPYRRK